MNMKDNEILQGFTVDPLLNAEEWRLITPNHPELYYIGRIDNRAPEAIVFIWQGTELRTRFSGRSIGFRFSGAWGQNFFNVIIDGEVQLLQLVAGETHVYMLNGMLADGMHELILYKRTEGKFSKCVFEGLLLDKGAQLGPKIEPLPLRIEFYGDSITVGACNEDPAVDQYDDLSSHNNYSSYGAITARDLNAEYVSIAVSGIGVCYSWNTLLLPDIYDWLYPEWNSPKYEFTGRKPDIVVVNIGQNDFGYSVIKDVAFPNDFEERFVGLIRNIRGLYPAARIVCAMGGMSAYNDSTELRAAFEKAVIELKAKDREIYLMSFTSFTYNHPRVDTHEKLAAELTAFLQKEVLGK